MRCGDSMVSTAYLASQMPPTPSLSRSRISSGRRSGPQRRARGRDDQRNRRRPRADTDGGRGGAMIAFLDGEVAEKAANRVVLLVQGVGYDVLVPTSVLADLPARGRPARVRTRMVVRDDGITLYGFATPEQRALFGLLTGVTG